MVQDLYVLMITAAVVSIVFKFLKQPVVLGYIVAGVLIGPNLFGETLVNADNVKAWGDIGVLFVLFCIGLEFRLKNLISSGKIAAVGAATIILPSSMTASQPSGRRTSLCCSGLCPIRPNSDSFPDPIW